MTNLISNAVKFSAPDIPVETELSCGPHGPARIEVRDRGPGIPREFQPRMFQRFSQADTSASRPKEGTGLGLWIAKGILDRLGGSIGFRSEGGEGTTFFVELPLATPIEAPSHPPLAAKEG